LSGSLKRRNEMESNSAQVSNAGLSLFKFTPKQLAITSLSMALSIFIYAWFFGLWFSFLLVVMMLVHEMGHVFAYRIKKMESSPPVFVPFLGAFITSPDLESDREKEAFVGYGGPFLGTIGALALFGLWVFLPSHPSVLLLASFFATFMNLFNLTPIRPLDGGRITQIISDQSMYVGALVLIGFTTLTNSPILWLGWVFFLGSAKMEMRLKIRFGIVVQALMLLHILALWYFGASITSNWLAFIIFVTLINLTRYRRYAFLKDMLKHKEELSKETVKEYETALVQIIPELPKALIKTRLKWFVLYVGLLIFALLLMAIQVVIMVQRARIPLGP